MHLLMFADPVDDESPISHGSSTSWTKFTPSPAPSYSTTFTAETPDRLVPTEDSPEPVSVEKLIADMGWTDDESLDQATPECSPITTDVKVPIDYSGFKALTVDFRKDLETYYSMERKEASGFTEIIWDVKQSTDELWSTLGEILSQGATGLYRHGKVGITGGAAWRWSGKGRVTGNSTRPHYKDFSRMLVLYCCEGRQCGILEAKAIETWQAKLLNEAPGSEGARSGEPMFLYLVGNTLDEMHAKQRERLAAKRRRQV